MRLVGKPIGFKSRNSCEFFHHFCSFYTISIWAHQYDTFIFKSLQKVIHLHTQEESVTTMSCYVNLNL